MLCRSSTPLVVELHDHTGLAAEQGQGLPLQVCPFANRYEPKGDVVERGVLHCRGIQKASRLREIRPVHHASALRMGLIALIVPHSHDDTGPQPSRIVMAAGRPCPVLTLIAPRELPVLGATVMADGEDSRKPPAARAVVALHNLSVSTDPAVHGCQRGVSGASTQTGRTVPPGTPANALLSRRKLAQPVPLDRGHSAAS